MERRIDIAFSPCPNDTFMFHALVHGAIDVRGCRFDAHIADVEELNRAALAARFPVSKLSAAAYLRVKDAYAILDTGAALGFGCGPLVVSREARPRIDGMTVAVPGEHTTAHLLFRLWCDGETRVVTARYDEIMPGVADGRFDAGVIIHEGRFVYPAYGLVKVVDLGEWWERETGGPIPLGCVAARRIDIDDAARCDLETLLRASIDHGMRNPAASRGFIRAHAQEMDDGVIDRHIALYVNEFSRSLGDAGRRAIDVLESRARERGLL